MLDILRSVFGDRAVELLVRIGEEADAFGARSFLVGGSVRDALRGIPGPDFDIMIEGNAPAFVDYLKESWSKILPEFVKPHRAVHFRKFRTSKLFFPEEILPGVTQLDFSSARGEHYTSSGAAPRVVFADMQTDLGRRDFSINAIAIELTPVRTGVLHDLFVGQEHLKRGELHVLHPKSFSDDPARLIRGVRFLQRFGFVFGEGTLPLFKEAVDENFLGRLPYGRRFDEFRKAFHEPNQRGTLHALAANKLLWQLDPALMAEPRPIEEVLSTQEHLITAAEFPWHAAIVSLFAKLPQEVLTRALAESKLSAVEQGAIRALRQQLG